MNSEILFVYGTLRRGGSNHFRMNGGLYLGSGFVMGRLFRVDWYPGLLLDRDGGEVFGDVYEVAPEVISALDKFEGAEYRRIRTQVVVGDGCECMDAWVWEYVGEFDDSMRIDCGDWLSVEGI